MRYHSSEQTYEKIILAEDTFATDYNVGHDFKWLVTVLTLQALLMCVFCGYQLVGIYMCNPLLKYRFWVSRCNKIALLFGLYVFAQLNFYRFREPGRICAGDYLNDAEWSTHYENSSFLIYQGAVFKFYIWAVWLAIALSIVIVVVIVKQMLQIFT